MLLNLLTKDRSVPIDEAALYAFLGYIAVFVGIIFLIVVVHMVGKAVSAKKKEQAPVVQEKQEEPAVPVLQSDEIDEETLAVITAALIAYYQTNNPKCEFTVKRIKRI